MKKDISDTYEVIIGLEVHAQLLTASKIYSSESAAYGNPPNTAVGVISLGHPGTLPRLNKRVVELAVKMGLACHADIARDQIFDRKNYFYPDLPKGYQITQDQTPLCRNGFVRIRSEGSWKNIHLTKIHIEEDAGKSLHGESETLLDFNRAGVPLIEIVTNPEIRSAAEATAFVSEVRKLVRYLGICDGNMEEGSLRCDANVSVRLCGVSKLGKKVEIKNLNSIRSLGRAIAYETTRQSKLLQEGKAVTSETRTYQADENKTFSMRTKEELNDYRYFPDPDLSPLHISDRWLEEIRQTMPVLPEEWISKFTTVYNWSEEDAMGLTESRETVQYVESVCAIYAHYKAVANWMMGPVRAYANAQGIEMDAFPLAPPRLVELMDLVDKGIISFSMAAQRLFPAMIAKPEEAAYALVETLHLRQDDNEEALVQVVEQVIKEFPLKVEAFRNGKKGIVTMFMGEVMKRTQGRANPSRAQELVSKKLQEL